jgi:hypothetical protein
VGAPAAGLVFGDHAVATLALAACAGSGDQVGWAREPASADCVALWQYAYERFGVVPYKGRVLRWPCPLGLAFRDLYTPTRCGGSVVPAFAAVSERCRRHDRTSHALRTALETALEHVGFGRDALAAADVGYVAAPLQTPAPSPGQGAGCAGPTSLCDVYAALLVRHRIVVHMCRYCKLPGDFWQIHEVRTTSGPRGNIGTGGAAEDVVRVGPHARAYCRRMYEPVRVIGASVPRYVIETSRWLRDARHARTTAYVDAMRSFLDCLGVHGNAAVCVARAAMASVELEAHTEAARDRALLGFLYDDGGGCGESCRDGGGGPGQGLGTRPALGPSFGPAFEPDLGGARGIGGAGDRGGGGRDALQQADLCTGFARVLRLDEGAPTEASLRLDADAASLVHCLDY